LQVSAPGYTADQLVVGVEPDCVTVQGKAEARQERERKNCLFSEFSSQEIFRRFALPGPINPDAVKATLEDGMLKIVMPRAEAAQPKAQAA
jgi:HSP20 family protein